MSHLFHLLQRLLLGVVFLGDFWFCLVLFGFVCVFAFRFFVSYVAFASLHALALSLTGAQRTDSSSASKKKSHSFHVAKASCGCGGFWLCCVFLLVFWFLLGLVWFLRFLPLLLCMPSSLH